MQTLGARIIYSLIHSSLALCQLSRKRFARIGHPGRGKGGLRRPSRAHCVPIGSFCFTSSGSRSIWPFCRSAFGQLCLPLRLLFSRRLVRLLRVLFVSSNRRNFSTAINLNLYTSSSNRSIDSAESELRSWQCARIEWKRDMNAD